jgi:hypothetical protein
MISFKHNSVGIIALYIKKKHHLLNKQQPTKYSEHNYFKLYESNKYKYLTQYIFYVNNFIINFSKHIIILLHIL